MLTKVVPILSFIMFTTAVVAQTVSPSVAFEERVYNFGTIMEAKGKVSHTFVFKNNGTAPITIEDIQSGCGCIGKAVDKAPVKPGGKGKVTITFDPGYKSGFFSKEIVVLTSGGQHYNRIWVEGNIIPTEHPIEDEYPYNFGNGLYLRLKVMAFGYVKQGETKQMQLHYANNTDKEMTLDFVVEGNREGLQFTTPGKIAPKAKGVINVTYTMPWINNDQVLFRLRPHVNNKKLPETLDIKVLNGNKQ
jgi:hypothetical protein